MEEELIRRYFKGELSESEQIEVEARKKKDSEFSDAMDAFKSMRDAIRLAQKGHLKARLREIESRKKRKRNFKFIAIAASIAIIIGVGSFLVWSQSMDSPKELYAEYYEPYPNVYAPITRDGDSITSLEQAFAHYEMGEYENALKGFDEELEVNYNQDVLFYKAMALIELDQPDEAQDVLSSINIDETNYRPQILWYRSLLLIQDEKFKKAKILLKKLDDLKSEFKSKKVLDLLEKLNK